MTKKIKLLINNPVIRIPKEFFKNENKNKKYTDISLTWDDSESIPSELSVVREDVKTKISEKEAVN